MAYEVVLHDNSIELVAGADGYAPEGPLTTFFSVDNGRRARLDAWSTRLLSLRTEHIVSIRRLDSAAPPLTTAAPGSWQPRIVGA